MTTEARDIRSCAAAAFFAASTLAIAFNSPVKAADACDVIAAKLVSQEGVAFERRGEKGTVFLKHPLAKSFQIDCDASARGPSLFISWANAYPSAPFYALLGRTAAVVVGKSAKAVEALAKRAHIAALKSKDEQSDIRSGGVEIECQTNTKENVASAFTIATDK